MSIISSNLVGSNLDFAITNISVTVTSVTPTNAETYKMNRQDSEVGFIVFDDGREQTVDTKFFLKKSDYTDLPAKGHILTDGTTNYKVMQPHTDSINVTLRLDCSSQYQRS